MDSAIIHVNFHPLCDPVSGAVIALPVHACQYLIHEVSLIIFLSFRPIGKLQQSGDSEKIVMITVFDPLVGDTLGTISSRARANIVGDSSLSSNQLLSPVMMCEKFWLWSFLSACNSVRASTTGFPLHVALRSWSTHLRVNFLIPRSRVRISLIVCGLVASLFASTCAERNGPLLRN
jgi:hypothetical protein